MAYHPYCDPRKGSPSPYRPEKAEKKKEEPKAEAKPAEPKKEAKPVKKK